MPKPKATRQLRDLESIGKAMLGDLAELGITSVAQLARADPQRLYDRLCAITHTQQDICVLDTFHAAVAQARDPDLPAAQRKWWYYSRKRKAAAARSGLPARRPERAAATSRSARSTAARRPS